MQRELSNIIVKLMDLTDDYYVESVAKGIESLKDNWPLKTEEEKKEVEAVAKALEIIINSDEDEDEDIDEYEENTTQSYEENIPEAQSNGKSLKKRMSVLDFFGNKD